MEKVSNFYLVSETQFQKDWAKTFPEETNGASVYSTITLPSRATAGSAGYDFYSPIDICLSPGEGMKLPTGIRCKIKEGWVLLLFPRSSLGFGYGLRLDNTVGVIDSDYFLADNEGHIFIKLTNGEKPLHISAGQAFCQGIFLPFGVTEDDTVEAKRTGGFGSTDK